jgi:hypothetical protein
MRGRYVPDLETANAMESNEAATNFQFLIRYGDGESGI